MLMVEYRCFRDLKAKLLYGTDDLSNGEAQYSSFDGMSAYFHVTEECGCVNFEENKEIKRDRRI